MAYFSKDNKASKAPALKALAKEYGLKVSMKVEHHSTFVLNIQSGAVNFFEDFIKDDNYGREYMTINPYWYHECFVGTSLEFLTKALEIMNAGNHNRSDVQSDYFDVGWYVGVNIGQYDKPYQLVK